MGRSTPCSPLDRQFDGRIMTPGQVRTAYRRSTSDLAGAAVLGRDDQTYPPRPPHAHGQTRSVTLPRFRTELTSGAIEVQGSIPFLFSAWGIRTPRSPGS